MMQQQQQILDQPMYGQQTSIHQQYTSHTQQPQQPTMYEPRSQGMGGEAVGGEGTPNITNFGCTPEDGFNTYLSSTPPAAGYGQTTETHGGGTHGGGGTQSAVSSSQAMPSGGAYRLLILVEGTQSLRRHWSVSLPTRPTGHIDA